MQTATLVRSVLLVGRESVGKTQLVSQMTGQYAIPANFRGSTVSVDRYREGDWEWIDVPGVLRSSDTETTRMALRELADHDTVMLIIQATSLDDDLHEMLPLVQGKQGVVVVTFWDKVHPGQASREALDRLEKESGLPFIPVNARCLQPKAQQLIRESLDRRSRFCHEQLESRAGWQIEPKPGLLEHRLVGPWLGGLLLLLPALVTVFGANRLADWLHPQVQKVTQPLSAWVDSHLPDWLALFLTAQQGEFAYGLLNMGPFLFVWALPTVILYALISAFYKTTGLIERINIAMHPMVRPFGLNGRDIVRVMMGFGCNVPAVISTRACSSCSRSTAIAAISFGAACSYQLPATLAVLNSAATSNQTSSVLLVFSFLGYLLLTTLVYLRLTAPAIARHRMNSLVHVRRPFLQAPTLRGIWVEVRSTLQQFFLQAMPVFLLICVAASLLTRSGVLELATGWVAPAMSLFHLPGEAALPVVMACIRKDGIFLLSSPKGLSTPMTSAQVLTAVYLAGVLLPCLVTAMQITREIGARRAFKIVIRQALFASVFSAILGWGTEIVTAIRM